MSVDLTTPVVVLCGGLGTRLREETEVRPKPMVEIGGSPILIHIMKTYAHHGFKNFILCLGYKGDSIKQFFYHFTMINNDFTIDLSNSSIEIHDTKGSLDWNVSLVDTGAEASTGTRLKRIEKLIKSENFMVTYGDGVIDLNIRHLVEFHQSHGQIGTVTGVSPPSYYGELFIHDGVVRSFKEKPSKSSSQINGGYFVFKTDFFKYLENDDRCVLEREPLNRLSKDGQLMVYNHTGFWQCMDTPRDMLFLRELWDSNKAPWKV